MQKSNVVRNNVCAAVMLSIVVLAFGLFAPKAHAAISPEELGRFEVQVNTITSIVAHLVSAHGQVAGVAASNSSNNASANSKALLAQQKVLQAQVKFLTDQITALTKLRDATQVKLDAVTLAIEEQTAAPVCTITTDAASYIVGDIITLSWTSKYATAASFVPDTSGKDTLVVPTGKQKVNGTTPINATVIGNPVVTLKVTGKNGKSATCTKTIPIAQVDEDQDDEDKPDVLIEGGDTSVTLDANSDAQTADDEGIFEINFEVTAVNSDVYIRSIVLSSAEDLTGGVNFLVKDSSGNSAVGEFAATLESSAENPAGYFQVPEGETEDFTLTVSFNPTTSGTYKLELTGVNWSKSSAGAVRNEKPTPVTDYDTDLLII